MASLVSVASPFCAPDLWHNPAWQKYNVSGPRYTSYPTALQLAPGFDLSHLQAAINQTSNTALSLYLHIPFCHQLCYYCGCNKIVTRHQDKADLYLDYLSEEIALKAPLFKRYSIKQLHLGGGTPTFLDNKQMSRLMAMLRAAFKFEPNVEMGIEADPRSLAPEQLSHLAMLGFNRLSFGIQDFNDDVQAAVNRSQDVAAIDRLFTQAKQLGFRSINADLIYGLPKQTPEKFAYTVAHLLSLSPDRVSVFNYAHLPSRFAAQRKIKDADLPNAQAKLSMLQQTIVTMQQAGYQFIGMDHFAKPDDNLAKAQRAGELHRNFQGYTTHGECDLLGLGVSAISQVGSLIAQNTTELKQYYQQLEAGECQGKGVQLNQDDTLRAALIKQLLCHFTLDIAAFAKRWNIEFASYFAPALTQLSAMQRDGLLQLTDEQIEVTELGRLFIRNICMCFDAYLNRADKLNRFSRVL